MPDAATAPTPTPGKLSPVQTILQSQQAIQDITGQEQAMAENLQKENAAREKSESEAIKSLETQRAGLQPPQIGELPKQPEVKQTDPIKQWSSAAMIFAAIGSLFTRRPLTTAMNAASGVLDAFRKNDIDAANAGYKQWQDSFNNFMKVQQFELDEYKSALGDIRDREQMVLDIGKQESSDRIAEVNAMGHAFGDRLMAEVRVEADAWKVIEEKERMAQTMLMQGPRLDILMAQARALHELEKSEQFQKASPPEKFAMIRGNENYAGLTFEQQDQQVKGMEVALTRQGTPGGDYIAAQRNLDAVERASAKGQAGGVIYQAEVQDAFTQIINGGRAIRGFQAKMNTEHAGLWDRMMAELNQYFTVTTNPDGTIKLMPGKGGNLSGRMIQDMKILSEQVAEDRRSVYAINIINAQEELKGRDVEDKRAETLHPYFSDTGYLEKMRKTIKLVRDHQGQPDGPALIKAFEDRFGIDARFAILAGVPIDDTGGAINTEPAPGQ